MRQIKNNFSLQTLLEHNNPLKDKYFDLTRGGDESLAKELKPRPEEQLQIKAILDSPDFLVMADQDRVIIWKFRYSLIENGKALVKFL